MNDYKVRFVPLGGIVGVTKNMYLYEIYEKVSGNYQLKDILIVDCGIGFPKEKELGVDFVIPDISYLKDKLIYIRGVVLTHGHEDHIGALPYLYQELNNPVIYASKLTAVFLENKFKENGIRGKIEKIDFNKQYQLDRFQIEFIKVTHSIPDTTHILIKTPIGNFYHGSDFKFDLTPPYGSTPDFYKITKAGKEGILSLLSDCLGAERSGLTLSESAVGQTFEDEMRKTKGKFIMTTFSSNISRIRQCVEAAIKFNRKIVFLGRSMKESTKLANSIGYLPIPDSFLINEEEVLKLPQNKICLIVAGSQAQYGSALTKLADKQNPYIKISQGDKIIFSSDPIPGNENDVYNLIEDLVSQGADVIYSDIADQLHSSGHGNQDDLKFLIRFTNPQFFIPIGGTIRHQKQYENLVNELGYEKNKVLKLKEGETVYFQRKTDGKVGSYLGERIEIKNIYIDAYGVGDVGSMVLRDRKTISTDGIVLAILIVDGQGRLLIQPRIVSRGFVFEKEEKSLYNQAIKAIEKIMKPGKEFVFNLNRIRKKVIDRLEELFYQEKGRRPLVIIEIIQF